MRRIGSVGAAAGPEVAIIDEAGSVLPPGEFGEVVVRGPSVFRGYENDPVANAEVFRGGWFRTGDQGYSDADGYLFVTGRIKEIINRGGDKVSPREVEERLMKHPAVAEAVVFPVPHSRLGEDVGAAIVLRERTASTVEEIRNFVSSGLTASKVPRRMIFVREIPKSATGKVQRVGLAQRLGVTAPGVREFVAPRTATEELLAGIWKQVLGLDQVGVYDDFFALGGHSLLAMQVIAWLRTTLDVEVSPGALFEAPTVANLAEVVDARQPQVAGLSVGSDPIRRRVNGDRCVLSFGQQRLWFLHQLDPGLPLYNIPCAVRLRGALNLGALQRSLDALLARHEVLRTDFALQDGGPVQVIAAAPGPVPLDVVDLRGWPLATRDAELERRLRESAACPFDLTRDLLLRAVVVQVVAHETVLLLVTHHIASDGWSLGVLFRELGALYEAFTHGCPTPLPDLRLQYADYAVWQRQALQGPALTASLAYWTQQLTGAPPVLDLPTDRPRPSVQTYRGAQHPFVLPAGLVADLLALSRRAGVTLFMTLLAAFQVLLHRLSGENDIVVGSPIAGRTRRELEPLVGIFVNTLALRTSLADDPSFWDLLGRVRRVTLGAYEHQELPFEQLVEELRPERSLGHAPLVQVMFVLHNTSPASLTLPGLTSTPVETETGASEFDLTLSLREVPNGLRGRVQYSTDLFDAPTIGRFCGHFQTLLEGIVSDPGQRVSALPLLTERERRQLLVEWNAPRAQASPPGCLHELLEAHAARSPEAVAVVFEDAALSYRALHQRANQLAHYLRTRGVGPDIRVGLCVERSLDLLVGVLGILKAGGAYVPLDPDYPADRLAFMLTDAQAPIVVTQAALRASLPTHEAQTICLDADWALIGQQPEAPPAAGVTAEHLAYVIYTSGSTGVPKGVQISHGGLVNLFESIRREPGLSAQDCLLAVTTASFDIAAAELLLPLMVGAKIVIASREVVGDGAQLVDHLSRHAVTVMSATPATWRLLLEAGWRGTPGLTIFTTGEAVSPELAAALLARGASVWNLYGPTETTIWSTLHRIGAAEDPVSIGRPIAQTELYILDAQRQPVPIGVPGELYIGGAGLARGYLGRPDLTAERFIAHSFRPEPDARLYRTGDRARYRPDGIVQYLGRLDHQVKLRGFRIELGEIETVLEQHPAVQQAAVVVRENRPGDQRLIAYVVTHPEAPPAAPDLRDYLSQRLPSYMIPAAFVPLDAMPLTPSGKVDRRALPAPIGDHNQPKPVAERAMTPTEQLIANIWRDVLAIETVSIRDNFFDLGGHSLLAMQVLHQIEKATGIKGRPKALLVHTLGQLASDYDERRTTSGTRPKRSLGRRIVTRIMGGRRDA
jgi:amino acid adenylation domain-containing protein